LPRSFAVVFIAEKKENKTKVAIKKITLQSLEINMIVTEVKGFILN
jgi:hypothetical protein